MLHQGQSIIPIQQKLALGLAVSERIGREGEIIRFGIQSSAMRVVSDVTIWRSEVEALMALDKYESAFALAQGMVSLEDRLHLLAVLAKTKYERGLSIESELDAQIRQLYKAIDVASLEKKALDIASDLIRSHPDLAIELVEKSSASEEDENALDWAMAKLSLQTSGRQRRKEESDDTIEQIRQRIRDPQAQSFSATASLLLSEHTADDAILEAKKLERASDQLYLLRLWAVENREREDAWRVTDYGLQLVLRTTDYAPNARVYRELATPIPEILDVSVTKRLIESLDAQRTAIERAGPTEDYVRLELLLAHGEMSYNVSAACNRLVEVYYYIIGLEDLSTQVACMARLVSALEHIDPDLNFEAENKIHSSSKNDLNETVDRLLLETASHFHVKRIKIKY
jgi:hypothetical protein